MTWIYILDLLGTLVFAISGVLTAINKKFDLVGSAIIGMVTAPSLLVAANSRFGEIVDCKDGYVTHPRGK